MKSAVISYPMLFQRVGGLQVQVRETLGALKEDGVDAALFDWRSDSLSDFDVIHVFGAVNGNYRIVEAAKSAGAKVVLSTVMHPPFGKSDRIRAELATRLSGRLTKWNVHTNYSQLRAALDGADRIIALGEQERRMLYRGYLVPEEKISIIPNGISERFFKADPTIFNERFQIPRPWIACVASVSPYKNQLTLVKALSGADTHVVIAGPVLPEYQNYLSDCLANDDKVTYAGLIDYDDEMLPSLYAAADAYVLPSLSEVMPLGVLEALAAGTPAIVTSNQSLDLAEKPNVLRFVEPNDKNGIRESIDEIMDTEGVHRQECSRYVDKFRWSSVARDIKGIYRELLSR